MATKNSKSKAVASSKKVTDNSQPSVKKKPSAEHLRPHMWKPGHCPNPGGRPKHDVAAIIARRVFEEMTDEEVLVMIRGLRGKVKGGDSKAFGVLAERGYGKQAQALEHSGPNGQPFQAPTFTVKFKEAAPLPAAPETPETK